ncbi:cell division protein ZapA [Thermodesulfobacterium sp. TA1]|uniref:cell division protein ZapA n=1 Tax=Thermodesulfobacterium sp. TA1 TaxID=2234087 RepID=UPI0012318EE9|nr:cell division protein ZapA [Thermodesulfobacterium sp. TA1]QER42300.1 cell division protein ZapA [Thermodesulfobacterium sp. TA1]
MLNSKEVSFNFLGQSFTFRAYISEEEITEVMAYLEEKKKEVENIKKVSTFKLAVWLLLQVAHDYVKLKKEKEQLEEYLKIQVLKLGEFLEKEKPYLGCSWKE